jgi:beta-glucosidase-like glycosyl hydrolase
MRRPVCPLLVASAVIVASALAAVDVRAPQPPLDKAAARWVDRTLAAMTLDDKAAQLVFPGLDSTFLSTDSDTFDRLRELVEKWHVGGFLVFGGSEPVPGVLLNPTYGSVILGDPLSAAATLNRLQRLSALPLLNAGDFEWGVGMRIRGATQFPRAMAFGAAGDTSLTEAAGRFTGIEMRAIGVHVDFAPVADVNNNPRNPVINTRSFGENPLRVSEHAVAFTRGLQNAGVVATLKHFPGHGDTDVDTHIGLATVPHARDRLDRVELAPFRAGIAAGAQAVMVGHLEVPTIDETTGMPATLSPKAITGLLRGDLGFGGLIVTDSMSMHAVSKMMAAGEAAVRTIEAGTDVVLHSPDDRAAVSALRDALTSGRLPVERIDRSVRRILEMKARLGLHVARTVVLDRVPELVGGRVHREVARSVSERAVTLMRDAHGSVPLQLPRTARILQLSIVDYLSGWRIAAPGRTFVPALTTRWPEVTAIELSDRSAAAELDLVRALAPRHDAIVVALYVRAASGSGRLDLSPEITRLLTTLARTASADRPMVACFFGNPYVAGSLPDVPTALLTYDFGDLAEGAAVRAVAGEIAIGGRLPITIPNTANAGDGLMRTAP